MDTQHVELQGFGEEGLCFHRTSERQQCTHINCDASEGMDTLQDQVATLQA